MRPDFRSIDLATCAAFNEHNKGAYIVRPKHLISASRERRHAFPRMVAMTAAVQGGRTLPEVGTWYGGRDHTTVLHATRRVAANPDLLAVLRSVGAILPTMPNWRNRFRDELAGARAVGGFIAALGSSEPVLLMVTAEQWSAEEFTARLGAVSVWRYEGRATRDSG